MLGVIRDIRFKAQIPEISVWTTALLKTWFSDIQSKLLKKVSAVKILQAVACVPCQHELDNVKHLFGSDPSVTDFCGNWSGPLRVRKGLKSSAMTLSYTISLEEMNHH